MRKNLMRFDWAMKRLLRSKANFGILEGFLSELFKANVKILELLESESNRTHEDDKQNRVDILAKLDGGEVVLIEIQVNNEYDYFYRMLFGVAKIITDHMNTGDLYEKVKKVYSVNILYFDLGHGQDYIYHGTTKFIGLHTHDELELNKKQRNLYEKEWVSQLYPEFYLLKVNQFNDLAKDTLDQWVYFLKNSEIKDSFNAKGIKEAKEKLNEINFSPSERKDHDKHIENLRYEASMLASNFKAGLVEGKAEGEKLGLEKGKVEGEKLGLEKGKLIIAKNLKDAGISIDLIQQTTGLTADEIQKI